ncbi:MAG: hypothetical protein AVDCRST_MAG65-1755, partial [uncultured Solirubrobacteraceae bacterium]
DRSNHPRHRRRVHRTSADARPRSHGIPGHHPARPRRCTGRLVPVHRAARHRRHGHVRPRRARGRSGRSHDPAGSLPRLRRSWAPRSLDRPL